MTPIPIIDTHLHLWDPNGVSYPWLSDVPKLNKSHLLADYDDAIGTLDVQKMVFVQCECDPSQYREELRWVAQLALQDPRIAGIVPWAPLEKGKDAFEEVQALTQNHLVKGIRRIIQTEPDIAFCLTPDFIDGVRMLADFDLSFDICIKHVHMTNTIKMVERCPDVRFVLDHIGKPDIKAGELNPWRDHLKTLANFPNVHCKMSGLVTEADCQHWTADDLRPYIDHTLACFGFDRIMFGGDWPVVSLASDYKRWFDVLAIALKGCSDDERSRLFYRNADAFYRLDSKE